MYLDEVRDSKNEVFTGDNEEQMYQHKRSEETKFRSEWCGVSETNTGETEFRLWQWNGKNLMGTDWVDCAGSFNRNRFKKILFF